LLSTRNDSPQSEIPENFTNLISEEEIFVFLLLVSYLYIPCRISYHSLTHNIANW